MSRKNHEPHFGKLGNQLDIRSLDGFAGILSQVDWSPASETVRHETRAILSWLWTRAKHGHLEFPFTLRAEDEDPPDFSLRIERISRGIEVTQISSSKNRAAHGHIKKNQPEGGIWMVAGEDQVLKPGDTIIGNGYVNDRAQKLFCNLVGEAIKKKCSMRYQLDAQRRLDSYSTNELVLYDTSYLGFAVEYSDVPRRRLRRTILDYLSPPFHSVSIVRWAEPSGWVLLNVEGGIDSSALRRPLLSPRQHSRDRPDPVSPATCRALPSDSGIEGEIAAEGGAPGALLVGAFFREGGGGNPVAESPIPRPNVSGE